MNGLAALRALGPVDLRSVWRDPLLRWFALLMPGMALGCRYLAPPVFEILSSWLETDLTPLVTPLMSFVLLMMAPAITGIVIGFLLLDQRDDGTLAALQVSPLGLAGYLAYRLALPMLIAFATTLVMFPIAGISGIRWGPLVLAALTGAPASVLVALFLAAFAANKVQGFALMKASGIVQWPPLFAFFVPMPWQLFFGLSPVYWPARLYWSALEGDSLYWIWLPLGLAWQALLASWLLCRFERVMRR